MGGWGLCESDNCFSIALLFDSHIKTGVKIMEKPVEKGVSQERKIVVISVVDEMEKDSKRQGGTKIFEWFIFDKKGYGPEEDCPLPSVQGDYGFAEFVKHCAREKIIRSETYTEGK